MRLSRHLHRLAAWIACFAVLAASLAPSISHALDAAGLSDYAPSMSGTTHSSHAADAARTASSQQGEHEPQDHASHSHAAHAHHGSAPDPGVSSQVSHDSHSSVMHFEHCPFCFTHAGSFGLAPFSAVIIAPAPGAPILPLLFYRAPTPLFTWTDAQPRAPPALS